MWYMIGRTSSPSSEEIRPCKRAVRIRRKKFEYGDLRWKIKIDTIKDLRDLIAEVGKVIVFQKSIEVYDNYRE